MKIFRGLFLLLTYLLLSNNTYGMKSEDKKRTNESLQHDEDSNNSKKIKIEEAENNQNDQEQVMCSVCYNDFSQTDYLSTDCCKKTTEYCVSCLVEVLKDFVGKNGISQLDTVTSEIFRVCVCNQILSSEQLKIILSKDQELFERYQESLQETENAPDSGELQENENLKKCPSCTGFIMKNGGCNKMECSTCNTLFCWACKKLFVFSQEKNEFVKDCGC